MEQSNRKILTKEQIKQDLEFVQHQHASSKSFLGALALLFTGILLIFASKDSTLFFAIGVCLILACVAVWLKMTLMDNKQIDSKDLDTLIYGTDICVGIEVTPETVDDSSYEYIVMVNGGRFLKGWGRNKGFPDSAKPREEFFTVSLQRNSKVCMYYSKDCWILEEEQEAEAIN